MQGRLEDYDKQLKEVKRKAITDSLSVPKMSSGAPSDTDDPKGSPDAGPAPHARSSDDEGTAALVTLERLSETDDQTGTVDLGDDGKKASLVYARGVREYREGRYENALAEFEEAVQLDPDNVSYLLSQSITLRDLGKLSESLEAINRAAGLRPSSAIVHSARALTLRMIGSEEEALDEEAMVRKLLSE